MVLLHGNQINGEKLIARCTGMRIPKFKDEVVSMFGLGLICDPGTALSSPKAMVDYSYMCFVIIVMTN